MKKAYRYNFENLDVWKLSIEFARDIYKVTESFPKTENFGLVSQIRRAVVSISSNLAEGSAKQSLKDQARFTEISFGSLMETLNQMIIAVELGYIKEKDYLELRRKYVEELSKKLSSLKNSQLKRYKNKSTISSQL